MKDNKSHKRNNKDESSPSGLQAISNGMLTGFVSVDPNQNNYSMDDYHAASDRVYCPTIYSLTKLMKNHGFYGFEVTYSKLFNRFRKFHVTFSTESILFSTACIRHFDNTCYVEILVNPREQLLAVRPCPKEFKNAVKWAKPEGLSISPCGINSAVSIRTLYELFNWDFDFKYCMYSIYEHKSDEPFIIFNTQKTGFVISNRLSFNSHGGSAVNMIPVWNIKHLQMKSPNHIQGNI